MGGCASVSRQNGLRRRVSTDGLRGRIQPCSFSGPLAGGGGGGGAGGGGGQGGGAGGGAGGGGQGGGQGGGAGGGEGGGHGWAEEALDGGFPLSVCGIHQPRKH